MTWNPEIENTPRVSLPHIWRLGRVSDIKFGTYVSNEILVNAAAFAVSDLLRENQPGRGGEGGGKMTQPHPG